MKTTLPSGRVFDANRGIIGLDEFGNLFEGYDGTLENYESEYAGVDPEFTPAERVEIADMMLARWQAYRQKHSK